MFGQVERGDGSVEQVDFYGEVDGEKVGMEDEVNIGKKF